MTGIGLLTLLAAICGIIASGFWLRFAVAGNATGGVAERSATRSLGNAALATGLAMGLASLSAILTLA